MVLVVDQVIQILSSREHFNRLILTMRVINWEMHCCVDSVLLVHELQLFPVDFQIFHVLLRLQI